MVVKAATKKRLMDMGVPDSVAHRLCDDRWWDIVKDLTWAEIMDIGYPQTYARYNNEENRARKTLEDTAKAQIIFYLIDPENRPNPADNMPDTPPTFGIFNWWWGEDYEEPNRTLKEWRRYHSFNNQELKGMLKYSKRNSSGQKPVLVARLMKEDLE